MSFRIPNNTQKFNTILSKNTFFFCNPEFDEQTEAHLSSRANLLILLKRELENQKTIESKKAAVTKFIMEKKDGLSAILALTSISEEFLVRLYTFIRSTDDADLAKLVNKAQFPTSTSFKEWSKLSFFNLIKSNKHIASGLVNLLFEGFSIPLLQTKVPLFELKKFTFSKLDFSPDSMIDSLVRYSRKGSNKAQCKSDAVNLVTALLNHNGISWQAKQKVEHIGRNIDLVIPNKSKPIIFVESSYEVTTGSGMGDKAKAEVGVAEDIRRYYPNSAFLGLIDGAGWYVRQNDLKTLTSAFSDVFTFEATELERFLHFVNDYLSQAQVE